MADQPPANRLAPTPRCLALGVVRREDGAVLLQTGYDPVKDEHFFRALGGGIEFGESSRDAFAREMREELDVEVADARLLGWIENIFSFEGRPGHEVIAVFAAALADRSLHDREETEVADQRLASKAVWVHLDAAAPVYPTGLRELLR